MKQPKDTHMLKRIFSSRMFLIVAFFITIGVGTGAVRAYYQHYQLQKEIQNLQADIESLRQKKLDSLEVLSYVMSPVFAEEKARVDLNMKKPGEHVAVIDHPDAYKTTETPRAVDAGQPAGNPIQWWYYFLIPSYE